MKIPTWIKLSIATIGVIISVSFLIIDPKKLSDTWIFIIALFGILSSYSQYLYKNSRLVFILCNKTYRFLGNQTVSWESSYKCYPTFNSNEEFVEIINQWKGQLGQNEYISNLKELGTPESSPSFRFKYKGRERLLNISYTNHTDKPYIVFNYSSSLAYRESLKEFDNFQKLLTKFSRELTEDTSYERKPFYTVKISFENWNPFYKMVINHFEKDEVDSYFIKIKDGDSNLVIENNQMKISSPSSDYISQAVKEYIVLSTVD